MASVKPKPRRRRRPEEAEREILDAAGELLSERPSHEVTVGALMERTTLSRKSFYVYFRDRHDLITRLVRPLRAEADAATEAWRESDEAFGPGPTILRTVAELYREHGAILRALAEASTRDADAAAAWGEMIDPAIAVAAEKIQREIERGRVSGIDPDETARALIGMNVQYFFSYLVGKPEADIDAIVETLTRIWWRAIYLQKLPEGIGGAAS